MEKKSIHWFFLFFHGAKAMNMYLVTTFFLPMRPRNHVTGPFPQQVHVVQEVMRNGQDINIVILKLEQWRLHMSENFSNRTLHNEQLIKDPIKVKQSTDDFKSSLGLMKRKNIESKWRPGLKHNYGIMNR